MSSDHDAAAQTAATSNTGAPTDSAPQQTDSTTDLELHPSAAIFPPMREAEFEALVADIREKGQVEPIWTLHGQVIDGRHRLKACRILGIVPRTREWDGNGSLTEFVVSANLRRRHLKENQRAMVAARLIPQLEEEAFKRKQTGGVVDSNQVANLLPGKTTNRVGQMLNISGRSVGSARTLLQKGTPDLIARVDQGKLAVSTAAKIAEFPPEEQTRLLGLTKPELSEALRPKEKAAAKTPLPKEATTHLGGPVFRAFSGELSYTPENGYKLKLSRNRFKRQFREAAAVLPP